jgi:hypothetical protein
MKKTLIISSYKDIHKLYEWVKLIPKDIQIHIYEKKDEILDTNNLLTNKISDNIIHYSIPVLGEQHFAFILHIINNYSQLDGMIYFTKTHWIPNFSNIQTFLEELQKDNILYEHNNTLRKFVYIYPDLQSIGHKHAVYDLIQKNNLNINHQDVYSHSPTCFECNNNIKCFNCSLIYINNSNTIFSTSYLKEDSSVFKKLKEIFPNYAAITEYNPCNSEGSYMIHSKIISFHSIDVYKNLYECLENGKLGCHDEQVIFFNLFFKETLRRYLAENN